MVEYLPFYLLNYYFLLLFILYCCVISIGHYNDNNY